MAGVSNPVPARDRAVPGDRRARGMTELDHTGGRARASCGVLSRAAAEDIRGTVPQVRAYTFLPMAGPWPRVIPPADPDPTARTFYYRPYPGWPTDERAFRWDVGRRTILLPAEHGQAETEGDGQWAPDPAARFVGVCIHGRHDACCGTRGGALVRRVRALLPDGPVYGVSHLGGDRFSATAVLFPSGYLLGRVDDLDDEQLHELVVDGLLPLGHVRGRLGSTPAEAVAEIWYRELTGQRDPAVLPTIKAGEPGSSGRFEVLVEDRERWWRLELARAPRAGTAIRPTCAAVSPGPVAGWDVTVIEERSRIVRD